MSQMETAAQAQEVAPNGNVPEWVHLLPLGQIDGRDGRRFSLPNPAIVVEAFAQNGADLAVDYEHQADNPAARASGPIPAAGWIKAMKATAEGVFGRIEWTDRARDMIAAKEYRYISPVIVYDKATREVGRISGAGLVHRPNLQLQALNAQDTAPATLAQPDKSQAVAAILDMLGLTADATATEVIAALLARVATPPVAPPATPPATPPVTPPSASAAQAQAIPDPTRFIEVAALNEVLEGADRERRAVDAERTREKIERAIREGFITPGMRTWATALCAQSEAMFDDFCEKSGPTFAYLLRPAAISRVPAVIHAAHSGSPVAVAVCEQLGLKPGALDA